MTAIVVSPQQKDDAITTVCCPDNALCHASLAVSMAMLLSPSSTSGNSLSYRNSDHHGNAKTTHSKKQTTKVFEFS